MSSGQGEAVSTTVAVDTASVTGCPSIHAATSPRSGGQPLLE